MYSYNAKQCVDYCIIIIIYILFVCSAVLWYNARLLNISIPPTLFVMSFRIQIVVIDCHVYDFSGLIGSSTTKTTLNRYWTTTISGFEWLLIDVRYNGRPHACACQVTTTVAVKKTQQNAI